MKITMKVLAMFSLLAMTLVGCGDDTEKETETSNGGITIAVVETYEEYFNEAGKAFEEETGTAVTVEVIDDMFAYLDDLSTKQGKAADIMLTPNDRVGSLAEQKLIKSVSLDLSAYTDNAMEASEFDGNQYLLPLSAETTLLIRNTDIIADEPASLQELGADNFQAKLNDFYVAGGMFTDTGAYIFGDDSSDIGLATPEAVEAGENIQSLYQSGNEALSILQDETIAYDVMMENFTNGEVGAIINGPWALGDIEKAGINYAISPIPSFDGEGNFQSITGIKGMVVNGYSDMGDDAEAFLNFVATAEYASKWNEMTSEVSPHTEVVYEEGSNGAVLFEATSNGVVMPTDPDFGKVWDPMKSALQQIAAGEDVTASLEAAVSAIETEIAAE